MKNKFVLDPADVSPSLYGSTASQGRQGQFTKTSRSIGLTGSRIELLHKPTGVLVSGEIPLGHYSRKEMIQRRKVLYDQLFAELEQKVPIFLRLPGY